MIRLLFLILMLAPTAHAETIKCPEQFPSKDITPSDNPVGREGVERVQKTGLTSAYMVSGELYSEQDMVPNIRKAKGGSDVGFSFPKDPKWLVCVYGESIEWWEQLDSKFTDCEIKIREIKKPHYSPNIWTATVTCK